MSKVIKETKKGGAEAPSVEVVQPSTKPPSNVLDVAKMPIPEDRDVCLEMIRLGIANAHYVAAIRYWHIGRIIVTCEERGYGTIREEVIQQVGCQLRLLQDCVRLYEQYTMVEPIAKFASVLPWSDVRLIPQLRNDENRKLLLDKVKDPNIDPKEASEMLHGLIQSEQEIRQEQTGKTDKRTKVGKAHNPTAVFTKADRFLQKVIRDLNKRVPELQQSIEYCFTNNVPDEDLPAYQEAFVPVDRALKELAGLVLSQQKVLSSLMQEGPPRASQAL
jgi:hypothetical protein